MVGHAGCLHSVHGCGPGLCGEERQDARAGPHVQHNTALEVGHVGQNGLLVRARPDVVLHHVLLLGQVAVKLPEKKTIVKGVANLLK